MRCDGMCCVMSRGAMPCHGDGPLYVAPCSGMECYELCELCGSKWFCDDVVLKSKTLPVLQSTTPVLTCTTYCTPLPPCTLQNTRVLPVLQSTTPALPCTTNYYSNTTK